MSEERKNNGPYRVWDGKSVHVRRDPAQRDLREIEISLTEGAALDLARVIHRIQQTTMIAPQWVVEIAEALGWVMHGNTVATAALRRGAENGSHLGMDPAESGPPLILHPFLEFAGSEDCGMLVKGDGQSDLCGKPVQEHIGSTWAASTTDPKLKALRKSQIPLDPREQ